MAETRTASRSSPPQAGPAPDWRATLRRAGRCWFGAAVLVLALSGLLTLDHWWTDMWPIVAIAAATALLSTLLALVLESVRGREVPAGSHVLLAGAAGGLVLGLLSLHPGFVVLGAVLGAVCAAFGVMITSGRSTWRRYLALTAGAVAVSVLLSLG